MRLLTNQKKSRSVLNVTPLIDVVFNLVLFFAVSSTFLEQPGIKLALPEAQKTDLQKIDKAVVFVTADQQIRLRDKEVSFDNLGSLLKDEMEQSLDKALIVNADKDVPHGLVVKIMDLARQNGVLKLVIATEQK
jgi:biopolymer transport protein ExbD